VLQRAATMLLTAVYEQDFLDCSYGFRPGRSAHQALKSLRDGLMGMWGGTVLELDIASFFDTLDHAALRSFLDKRIGDGVIRRVIGKWLNAGVMEAGTWRTTETGSPQGGVISPILANIYLHEVLDLWFAREVQPRMRGRSFMVRYADDAVLVFEHEQDARRVLEVLAKRFGRFGLRLHPNKTRLVKFRSPKKAFGKDDDRGSGTFDFLGFTHFWKVSRQGHDVVQTKTSRKRLSRALRDIGQWCREHRHWRVRDQHRMLVQKIRGHYAYYGICGNCFSVSCFYHRARALWRKWLDRRSWKAHMTWERFARLQSCYPLPKPRLRAAVT
jgi:RNA-directed DNA polymerase